MSPDVSRPVSGVSWSSHQDEKIAISYASPEFLGWMDIKSYDGFIFNVNNPTKYYQRISSASCITSLQFNPKDENQVSTCRIKLN